MRATSHIEGSAPARVSAPCRKDERGKAIALECPSRMRFRRRARGRLLCTTTVLLLAGSFQFAGRAVIAGPSHSEYQVKAAYLFNFLKFVEWPGEEPSDPQAKWVIGIVGASAVGAELALLADGKSVEGHGVRVKKFGYKDNLRGCNILFISASEERHLGAILNSLEGSSVLTVADLDKFIARGGMIQFVTDGDRVRMEVDLGATGRVKLKVSSKLLALAQAVTETARSTHN